MSNQQAAQDDLVDMIETALDRAKDDIGKRNDPDIAVKRLSEIRRAIHRLISYQIIVGRSNQRVEAAHQSRIAQLESVIASLERAFNDARAA